MVGKYLSTPIYKFKMKCHMCPQMHEMRTDPKNFEYVCVSGCRRDIRTWDMEENGQVSFTDSAERARLDTDPMYKLEKGLAGFFYFDGFSAISRFLERILMEHIE